VGVGTIVGVAVGTGVAVGDGASVGRSLDVAEGVGAGLGLQLGLGVGDDGAVEAVGGGVCPPRQAARRIEAAASGTSRQTDPSLERRGGT
jgi:hypothetical protein